MTCSGCGCKHEGRHTNRDCPEIHKRAIIAPTWYAIVTIQAGDPKMACFVVDDDERGDVRLFSTREGAFNYAAEYVNDPWQIVEI